MLGPCLGEPLSNQLRHIVECCEPDCQELDKKRDSYIKAHRPEPGERGPFGLFTDQKHLVQTMPIRLGMKNRDPAEL